MTVRLDGKVAVVTGPSTGVGKGIALMLAERGVHVIGMARRLEPLELLAMEIEGRGGKFTSVIGDVGRSEDCNAVVETALEQHGKLDILINNAASVLPYRRVEDLTDENWRSVMSTTLDGVFYMSRAALPSMQARRDGVIITISSVASEQSFNRASPYSTSKAAVNRLMKSIAVENADLGVRANAILCGTVATELGVDTLIDMGQFVLGPDWTPDLDAPPSVLAKSMMTADQVGRAVALLCSDDGREINGALIAVDRGWTSGKVFSEMLYLGASQQLPPMETECLQ